MEYHSGGSLPLLGRPRYCPGANANGGYLCETGHCCGESGCCTYYYELWWFWLLWTVLILFSCCCAYRHRRAKLRVQQQQRQRDISLLAYQGASSFPSSMLDLSFLTSLKLPSYEEVAAQPSTPPPPYSSVFTAPRYPQPPRAAHPHLLSQHPGDPQHPGATHRPLQPLSDGPSSLSSDNSSSCSCDSCCPSSPCSSSLSAPVTYETDTSHASTPSEAMPLALDPVAMDPVAMETISAAAARLAPTPGLKDDSAAVAILIERATAPAEVTERITAAAAGSASLLESKASSDSNATFPVEITVPIKQQLEGTLTSSGPSCLQSTEHSTSPDSGSDPARTLDTSVKQPRTLTLILDSVGGAADTNPSLVPISVSPQNLPRAVLANETHCSKSQSKIQETCPSQESTASKTVHLVDTLHSVPNFTDPSSPSQGIAHFSTKPAGESSELTTEAPNVTRLSEEPEYQLKSLSNATETTSQAPVNARKETEHLRDIFGLNAQTSELSKSTETVAINDDRSTEKADSLLQTPQTVSESVAAPLELSHPAQTSSELPQSSDSQATKSSPILNQDPVTFSADAKILPPGLATSLPEPSQPTESVSISVPDPLNPECPSISPQDAVAEDKQGNFTTSLEFCTENTLLMPEVSAQPAAKANSSAEDVFLPTFDQETGKLSVMNLEVIDSKLLNLENSRMNLVMANENPTSPVACSFFPAITIQANPPSFATSPCSIPESPSGAMLLLDPLAALPPSEKSAASSGHASSLSPSPRNTQSPPKQTLFSPCVDVFEPVNPNWEDDESEEQPDEEYCEDSDVAADESQYRHRRLTGDSGIEVCRCRVEDEEEEELETAKKQDGGERKAAGVAALHDSVDCPVRSQKSSSGEHSARCNSEASAKKLAIPVETV